MNFTFNGISASSFGLWVEHRPPVVTPKRLIESISIPGRSGNLLRDTGAYSNITLTYQVAYKEDVRNKAVEIATWLYQPTYCELENDYEPTYFRQAVYSSPFSVSDVLGVAGRANITFECKPQRFLKTGKIPISATNGGEINNNYQPSLPVITIQGSGHGSVTIGGSTVSITGQIDDLIIDSVNQNAVMGGNNANNNISVSGGFPTLVNGATEISWSGGVTGVTIVPNWWTL